MYLRGALVSATDIVYSTDDISLMLLQHLQSLNNAANATAGRYHHVLCYLALLSDSKTSDYALHQAFV